MPRRQQYTAEDVVRAAFELVRQKGLKGLSAPSVAAEMGCSTMPIYSHFKNMQALEDEVVKKVWKVVMKYQAKCYTGDVWIDQAIGYVHFAREEKNLFKCMLDGRNLELKYQMNLRHWENQTENLKGYDAFKDLDDEKIMRARYSRAMLSHGIATSARIGLNKIFIENDDLLCRFLTDASQALLEGYLKIPPIEGEQRRLLEEKRKKLIDIQT